MIYVETVSSKVRNLTSLLNRRVETYMKNIKINKSLRSTRVQIASLNYPHKSFHYMR